MLKCLLFSPQDDELSPTNEAESGAPAAEKTENAGGAADGEGEGEEELEDEEPTKTVVYFWQGREASELAWLTFNFSLRKDMEARLSRNPNGRPQSVEFKRVKQQQEDMYFLAHFLRKMVIHSGSYRDRDSEQLLDRVHFYHLRMNGNPIATRCLEVGTSRLPPLSSN